MATGQLEKQLKELDGLRAKGVLSEDEYQARRQVLVADVSHSATKSGRGVFKWGFIGCFGILAGLGLLVVLVFALLAAALGNQGDDSPDSGGDVRVALVDGASGEIAPEGNGSKKAKVTILETRDDAESSNQFESPAVGKKYYALRVRVENAGSAEITSLDWLLRDSKNGETRPTFVSGIGEPLDVAYTLTPGGATEGWVVFEIPREATPSWIRADPNPFLADDLYFDVK